MLDPLDIMSNIEEVVPHFQAIFSADAHAVIGYEVLGRITLKDEVKSLGSFFTDKNVPEEYQIEVDHLIIYKAIQKLILDDSTDVKLFINQNASLLLKDQGERLLELFLEYEKAGLNLSRLVIEIDVPNSNDDLELLQHLIQYYKTYGIQIALSHIGHSSMNMDKFSLLSPSILKIDLKMLRNSYDIQTHQDFLHSISIFARKMGTTLLYENVEASFQLQYAWRNGGRYYQGYYLHKPEPNFINCYYGKELLTEKFQHFVRYEKRKLEAIFQLANEIQEKVQQFALKNKLPETRELVDQWLLELAIPLTPYSFRMYLCDENGYQQSSNISRNDDGKWTIQEKYYLKNWSWRPYFLENVMKMRTGKKGILTDIYSDIETQETIRTFSYSINHSIFLYVDISYSYLYEHNDLL
ncbi:MULTISPECIES: EAL domain-containing protein [Bacillus]|uniref:EAL domain-containing protein n=1 Tax=Bacillus TaxID=1386 RepID=UPI000BB7670C|nr:MULTISPECIES: EAL-associated domain-containing protein [Bacillus]